MNDQRVVVGRWIIAVHKHLEEYRPSREHTYLERVVTAAKCGRLMGRLRKLEMVPLQKLKAIASDLAIYEWELANRIVPLLEDHDLVSVLRSDEEIEQVLEYGLSEAHILEQTASIWESLNPSDVERAILIGIDLCSVRPIKLSELGDRLERDGFTHEEVQHSVQLQKSFELVHETAIKGLKEQYLYNEYLWGDRIEDVARFLEQLDVHGRTYLTSLLRELRGNQGKPMRFMAQVPKQLLRGSEKLGIIDSVPIVTTEGREEVFCFTPHFFGTDVAGSPPFDVYDQIKLFVASILYGHQFAKIQIKSPVYLVRALLRDGEVGPATPIGTDYPLLEREGIIEVRETSHGWYKMVLVKEDVVEKGLRVLEAGGLEDMGPFVQSDANGLYVPRSYVSPEQRRIRLGRVPTASKIAEERVIRAMRGEELI